MSLVSGSKASVLAAGWPPSGSPLLGVRFVLHSDSLGFGRRLSRAGLRGFRYVPARCSTARAEPTAVFDSMGESPWVTEQ